MSLRFIYGGAGSGKSSYCLKDIKNRIDQGFQGKLVLIVPDQFSFQAEKNLIKAVGEAGLLKAEVLSFKRMAYHVFNEVGGITNTHINAAGRNMLIYKVMESVKGELKYFATAGRQKGFIKIVSDIITEFKRYEVTPELLQKVEGDLEDEDLKNKINDIQLIYSKFEELLRDKFLDPEDDITLLSKKIDESLAFNGAEIWIDEFSSFTTQQYSVIEKLLRKARRVNVTMNTRKLGQDLNIFMPILNLENMLLNIIAENNIPYDIPLQVEGKSYSRFTESGELKHLEENLLLYPNKQYAFNCEQLFIHKSLNEYEEVESVARNITAICRDKGYRYRDIAIVARDLDSYSNLIKVIFNQYNIPFFMDEKRDIDRNPLVILINSVIDIFSKNWSYEAMFAYLKTGLVGLDRAEIDILENYVLANGIKGKKWAEEKWNYRLTYGFQNEEIPPKELELIESINAIKLKVVTPLVALQQNLKNSATVKEICTTIYDFMVFETIPEKLEGWMAEFKAAGDYERVSEYSQVWNIAMELLDQLVTIMGDEKIKLDEFAKLFITGVKEYKIGLIPPSLDQVLVGDIERVKSHEVAAVYILGVNDGVFPMTATSEGILSDRDRLKLKDYGVEIAQDTRSRAREEQYLTYKTFTLAKKLLGVSYPISNFEGKALRPSIIIARLKKIFPLLVEQGNIIEKHTEEEALELVSLPKPTFQEFVYSVRRAAEGEELNPVWQQVYGWYNKELHWKTKSQSVFDGLRYTNQVNIVDQGKIKKLYGSPLQFSVSRLEKYAECPFAYYVQYGLKAKERKIYELSAPDLGSFMHGVIDQFSEKLENDKVNWRDVEENWCRDNVSEIVEEQVNKKNGYILASSPRYRYLVERLKRLLTKSVWTITQHVKGGSFNPSGHEIEFGKSPEFPPIVMELSSGEKISLTGRIDRVDEMVAEEGTYLRIIDYKSGPKNFKLAEVYYGLQLQLLVYLDSILSNWKKYEASNNIPGAILYFKIDDPIVPTDGENSEETIEKEIMKRLKMQGLLLKDARIIKEMDKNLERYSLIIPAQVNADGSLSGNTSSATREEFEILTKYVRTIVVSLCEEMLQGNISILPCKKKDYIACNFCEYAAICKFDVTIRDNKYKLLLDKSDEELWKLMREALEGKEEVEV